MIETLSLFPEPEPDIKQHLRMRLKELSAQRIYMGTSSWKYEGWLDSIYSRQRYLSNGKFSRKRFEAEALVEYAETFPIVCGDFAFYQFPTRKFWQKLFAQVPRNFQFAFKAPEEITRPRFPGHPRYGARAGSVNAGFLNSDLFITQFLDLLSPYADRVPLIIFEFGAMKVNNFAEELSPFLKSLPKTFRYAVEIRNTELLHEDYLAVLRENGVAHVFNAWTGMPPLASQMELAQAFTTDFTVSRALLTPGRTYEEAVALFSPYTQVREPNEEVRDALGRLVSRARVQRETAYIFVNNRLEGFAPGTMVGVLERVSLED